MRRVTVLLQKPTRDGATEFHIATNLTPSEADAVKVAERYQGYWTIEGHWTIEVVFLQLKTALPCEINTPGYPKAALFTFCVALLLENTRSMLLGSLRAAHGDEAVEELSGDSLAYELRNTYEGLMVATEPEHWVVFFEMSLTEFAQTLLNLAKTLDLTRDRKRRRAPPKPATPRTQYHNGGYASTAKILALRKFN